MTNLKEVNFGINQYCGPAVLSALTGESTDRCAAVISAVSGRREIRAVDRADLKEALKRLKFDITETKFGGGTLFGTLHRMYNKNGLYIVFVPHHVVAVEVKDSQIYICDNHTKTPIEIKQSARLMQKCQDVWEVTPHPIPKYLRTEIRIFQGFKGIDIFRKLIYENEEDNITEVIGNIRSISNSEIFKIVEELDNWVQVNR